MKMNKKNSKENKKNCQFNIRLSDKEFEEIEFIQSKTGKSKSDILRNGLRMYANLVHYQE